MAILLRRGFKEKKKMVKQYRFSRRLTYLSGLTGTIAGIVILFFSRSVPFGHLLGIIVIVLSILCFFMLKHEKIEINDEFLTGPRYDRLWPKSRIKIKWNDIAVVSSLRSISEGWNTYVIPRAEGAKDKLDKSNMIRITPGIQDYQDLVRNICEKATGASIDEETKQMIERRTKCRKR